MVTKLIIRIPKKREKEEFEIKIQPAIKHQKKIKIEEKWTMEKQDIIIKDEYSDLKVKILSNGWTSIIAENGDIEISLGCYPNKRFEVLKRMFDKLERKWKNVILSQ